MKEILCTIDFSEASKDAVRWSVEMSRKLHCPLTILYTYRLTKGLNGEALTWKKKLEDEANEKFKKLESEFLVGAGIPYKFKVEVGFVADRVGEHARKNGISFLVMDRHFGTHSREAFEDLIESIHVPLVIVPS